MYLSDFMNLLDEHKQTMPENTYVTMANELKRKFDEIGGDEIYDFTVFEIKDVMVSTLSDEEEELPDDCDLSQWDHTGLRTVNGKQTMNKPYKVTMTLRKFYDDYKLANQHYCMNYSDGHINSFNWFKRHTVDSDNPIYPFHFAREGAVTPMHFGKAVITTTNKYLYSIVKVQGGN